MKVLAIIKDLVLSTQIRTACQALGHDYKSVKNSESLKDALNERPDVIVIDLNIQGVDPLEAVRISLGTAGSAKVICFYSHVNVELGENAVKSGIKPENLFVRSKFFSHLNQIFSDNM